MQGFLRRGVERKRCYGFLFIFMPLYGLLVLLLLKESHSILFSLVGSWLVFEIGDLLASLCLRFLGFFFCFRLSMESVSILLLDQVCT